MMKKLFQQIRTYSLDHQLGDAKGEFLEYIRLSTFSNVKKLIFVLMVFHLLILPVDYINYKSELWVSTPGYQYLCYAHLAFIVLAVIFFIPLLISRYLLGLSAFPWYYPLTQFTVFVIFIWCAGVSSIDQLIHGQITAYILCIFCATAFFNLPNPSSLIFYAIPSLVFFAGVTWLQTDRAVLQGHYINGSVLVVLGWIIGRMIFYGKVTEFKNRKLIEHQNNMLEKMSVEDSLTGLHNRRYLEALMQRCLAVAERYGTPLIFAICDIDRFKNINDDFSHQIGDSVLRMIAGIFKHNTRKTDEIARYGGDEFIFIFTRVTLSDAAGRCERIRQLVESHNWNTIAPGLKITISFGLAEIKSQKTFDEIFPDADSKLYAAKKKGRNQVVF